MNEHCKNCSVFGMLIEECHGVNLFFFFFFLVLILKQKLEYTIWIEYECWSYCSHLKCVQNAFAPFDQITQRPNQKKDKKKEEDEENWTESYVFWFYGRRDRQTYVNAEYVDGFCWNIMAVFMYDFEFICWYSVIRSFRDDMICAPMFSTGRIYVNYVT